MEIKKTQLLEALKNVTPAIAGNEMIEQSTHVCFEKEHVRAYNDRISIMYSLETDIKGAIKASEFISLLEKLHSKKIQIEQKEEVLNISVGKMQAAIKINTNVKLHKIDFSKISKWSSLPSNFKEAISFAIFSASKSMITQELACIFVSQNLVLSCDNFRGTKVYLSGKEINTKMLIPVSSAIELVKYNPIKYSQDNSWIHFKDENDTIFSCRKVEGEYPIETVLNLFKKKGEKVILPSNLDKIIDRVQTLVRVDFEQDKAVSLTFEKDKLVCKGEGELGWIQEFANINYKGKKISLLIHPQFLIEALKHLREIIIGESVIYMKGDNFEHVISVINKDEE